MKNNKGQVLVLFIMILPVIFIGVACIIDSSYMMYQKNRLDNINRDVLNSLKDNNYESKMIMQIHDELVFDVLEKEKEVLVPLLTRMMEEASNLNVKLKAESGIGKDWYSAK